MEATYLTNKPIIYTMVVLFIFLFTALIFMLYDMFMERRQKVVLNTAIKSSAVVQSLFPEIVRDRLMDQAAAPAESNGPNHQKSILYGGEEASPTSGDDSKVIADFFPESMVLFADVHGFTAWCSEREPVQVFLL